MTETRAEIRLPTQELRNDLPFFTKTLKMRLDMIYPADNPQIVVAVIVQRANSGGGAVAAPIAGKIFQKYFEKTNQIQPEAPSPMQVAANLPNPTTSGNAEPNVKIEQ